MNASQKGVLALVGGAEDKDYDKLVLKRIWEINRAKNIVIVPSASRYVEDLGREYRHIFEELGGLSVNYLDIRRKEDTQLPLYYSLVSEADLIFFTGGDQVRLASIFLGTRLFQLIKRRFLNHGTTIAGTSAGAAIQSKILLFDGDDYGFHKGSVKSSEGFGFLPRIAIDTHFMNRNRIPRLAQFLASGIKKKGIGISEDAGVFIYPNDRMEVVGGGIVVLMNADRMNYTNYFSINEHEFVAANNIRFSFLVHGNMFDLKKWNVVLTRNQLFEGLDTSWEEYM